MEISGELKTLYRHSQWNPTLNTPSNIDMDIFNEMIEFANERMMIYSRKISLEKSPYTNDEILHKYRFCNIYRELDRQTIEIHKLLNPIIDDFDLWLLNMAFNRFLCNPETFKKIGFLNFNEANNKKVMQKLIDLPSPKYGVAYIFPISAIQKSKYDTREKFFTQYLPKVLKKVSKEIQRFDDISVIEALEKVLPIFGFNFRFHWTEILIDVAYQCPDLIDLYKPFHIGPGSIPTMKRLSDIDPMDTLMELTNLSEYKFEGLTFNGKQIPLSSENWEGIGCEFRKYTNLRKGEGRRRLYKNKTS